MSFDEDKNKNLLEEGSGELELSGHISIDVHDTEKNTPKDNNLLNEKDALESMGFPRPLIDKIYSVMHPANIEEALDYLNKNDNDKFTHSYIPNASNFCSICGYKRSDHQIDDILNAQLEKKELKIEEKKNNFLDDDDDDDVDPDLRNMFNKYKNKFTNNSYEDYNYKYESAKECGVCAETIESKDIPKIRLSCKHYFCIDCWKEYLKEKINNANVYKLTCMQSKCNHILEEKFIKAILDKDEALQEKYDKFLKRKKLMDSNKKVTQSLPNDAKLLWHGLCRQTYCRGRG